MEHLYREQRFLFQNLSPEASSQPEEKEGEKKQEETPDTLLTQCHERAETLIENLRQVYSENGDPLEGEADAVQTALTELLANRATDIANIYEEIDRDIQALIQVIEDAERRLKEEKNPLNLTEHVLTTEQSESYKVLHDFSVPTENGNHAPFTVNVSYPETRLVPQRVLRPARLFNGRLCGRKEWVTCGYREVTETVHKRYQITPEAFKNTPKNSLRIDPIGQIRLYSVTDGNARYGIGVRRGFEGSFTLSGDGFNYALSSGGNKEYRPKETSPTIDAAALAAEMKEEAFLAKASKLQKESEGLKNALITTSEDPDARIAAAKAYFESLHHEAGYWRVEREEGMLDDAFAITRNRLIIEGTETRDLIRQLERDKKQDQRLDDIESVDRKQDTAIEGLRKQDNKFEKTINELRKRDKHLADRITELTAKDLHFAQQIIELADRDISLAKQIAELSVRDTVLAKKIAGLSQTNEDRARRILMLEERHEEMRKRMEELEKRVHDSEHEELWEMRAREFDREFLEQREKELAEEEVKLLQEAQEKLDDAEMLVEKRQNEQPPIESLPDTDPPESPGTTSPIDIQRARPGEVLQPEIAKDTASSMLRTPTPPRQPPDPIEAEHRPENPDHRDMLKSPTWDAIMKLDLQEAAKNPDGENGIALQANLNKLNITRFDQEGQQKVLDEFNKKLRGEGVRLEMDEDGGGFNIVKE